MKRQMGAKTSGNFWHIILGHGHCGGVGAQRIEINTVTSIIIIIIVIVVVIIIIIIIVIIIIVNFNVSIIS